GSAASRSGAAAGSGCAPRPIAVRKRTAEPVGVGAPAIVVTAAAIVEPPTERSGGRRGGQQRTQRNDRQLFHFLPPLALLAAAVGGSGLIATWTASAGGWKTNSASAGWLLKFQSENSAMKLGCPGSAP